MRKYLEKENNIFGGGGEEWRRKRRRRKTEKEKEEHIWSWEIENGEGKGGKYLVEEKKNGGDRGKM